MNVLNARQMLLIFLLLPTAGIAFSVFDERRPCSAAEREAYDEQLRQQLYSSWNVPRANQSYSCSLIIAQNFRGEVLNVGVEKCSEENLAIRKSVEDAAYRASPLPLPENRACFSRTLKIWLTHRAQGEQ